MFSPERPLTPRAWFGFAGIFLLSLGLLSAQPQSQLFQEWQADPANAILPDFSFAGFAHGEQSPPRVTAAQLPVYHVRDFGAFPDDGIDDRVAIQRAIDTAGANGGGIIQFDAGRYLLNSDGSAAPLWVRYSNIILRGAGSGEDGTLLYGAAKYDWFFAQWTQPSMVHIAAPILKGVGLSYGDWNGVPGQDWYTGGWRNSAFYPDVDLRLALGLETIQRGSQRIKVDQPENFYPGQTILFGVRDKMVVVDLLDPWKHEDFYHDGNDGWIQREFVIHQVVTVEAVEGAYIRIKERAEWTYKLEHSIEIFPYRYIANVGVEDMRMEIVITPRDDRWDANGKGLQFAHVRNGWADNIVFVNMQSGLNLSATMNVTVSNVRLEGEPFHDSFKFLGAKYSLMENAVINNFTIREDGSIRNTDHGFAAQHHAQLNVYLDPVMPPNCSIDLHSGEPFANLYDRVVGGRHGGSGGAAMTLHALPYHTFWNWSVKATDKVPYQFPVWIGNQVQPYSPWSLHTVKPIVSGLHPHPDFPNTVSVQYTAAHDFSTGYFNDPRVVAERIGTRVAPDSLYLAQLSDRLSRERGRTEREGGIFVAIDGPTWVVSGQAVSYDLSQSLSELPLKFYYSLDRRNYTPVSGTSLTLNLTEVGLHELTVRAVSSSGSVNFRHHRIEVFDDGIQVVSPRSRYTAMPRSFHSIEAGNIWQSKLIYDEGLKMETSSLWIAGNNFGIANESRNATLNYGGIIFRELPEDGLNLAGTSFKIGIGGLFGSFPQAPRVVARDIHGNWAMLDHALVSGTNTFDLAGKAWINLPSQYQIISNATAFDATKVAAVGLAHHRQRINFLLRSFLLRVDEFSITRGSNTPPTVALTSPFASTIEVGDSVSFAATASDAESAVTRVEFLINGKVFAIDRSAPYSATWKPGSAGTYTIAARAYDTTGASTESAAVELTVAADTATVAPGLTGPSVATATVGQPFSFAFGVTGKASSMRATGIPAGLNFNAYTGAIDGVPLRAGTYTITVLASNVSGTSPAKTLTLTVNTSATASLALSVDGSGVYTAGESIRLSAIGHNTGSSVEFLVNGSVVDSSGSSPHSTNWSTLTPGVYQLQARSGSVYSPVRQIALVSASLDAVAIAITSPQNGAAFSGGNPVITLSGTLEDSGGDVSSVSLYANAELLGQATVTGSTFSFDWTAWVGYDHRIKAVANLHSGKGVQSEVILVDVTLSERPFVEILSPSPTVPVDFREALRFNGRAYDPDGTLARVELWMGPNNRGDDTFDTFLGNATLNADGTWTYLASSNLRNGTLPIYAIAIDNTGDKTFTPILRVFRSARFADDPVYGDAGTYSMDLGESSRWDLLQDGDNVVLLNKERFSYNYDWQNFLPNSNVDHFRISGRFRLPHYPEPSSPDFVQAAIIGFGTNKAVYLTTTPGTNTGGTRVYWTIRQYVTSIVNSPVPGIASNDWIEFEVVRVDNTISVKLNGETVMSGTDNYVRGAGSVYLGNPRLNGSRIYWDDIEFQELDGSGQPLNRPLKTVTLNSPVNQSLLPIGEPVTISGSFSNIDTVDTIQIRSGTAVIGEAMLDGNNFSFNWTPQHAGNYALYASVTDSEGVSTVSNVLRVRTGEGFSGFNEAPTVNLLQPEGNLTRVEYTTIPFSGNFVDTDGQVDGLLMIVNGNVGGAATRSGTAWSWNMPQLEAGAYTVFARATDDMGAISESSAITVTLTPNQLPVAAWNQPAQDAQIVANSQTELSLIASDPDSPLGNITSVTFYANNIQIGQGINATGEVWSMNWTPRILGNYELRALVKDSNRGEVWTSIRDVTVTVDPDPAIATVFYAGGSGYQELLDINELSDGTVLAVGATSNLDWLPAGTVPVALSAPGLTSRGTGRMGFLLHLSADMETILGFFHLPVDYAENLRWIRKTSKPGDPTGTLYLSGALSHNQYFVGRLDNNFVNGLPGGLEWTVSATTSGNSVGEQAWDVGGDGRVVYLDTGLNSVGTHVQMIRIIDAQGQPMVLPQLRATHLAGSTDLTAGAFDPANPDNFGPRRGELFPTANASLISVPRDFRSQVVYERDEFNEIVFIDRYTPATLWEEDAFGTGIGDWREMIPDENGSMKRGRWPMDIFLPAINFQWKDGRWVTYGYTGYRQGPDIGIPAITVDKETNDFYVGVSAQSVFYDISVYGGPEGHQPDFEAFVIAYAGDGERKWWSRLYSEWTDTNGNGVIDYGPENEFFWVNSETHRSPPDQYVDGIAIDYSSDPKTVIVNGRAHGNAPMNLWSGNQIAANPGANGFQNNFTGSEGNIHISWLGRMNADVGTLYNSTWVSGYFRNVAQTQSLYPEPIHDGWPSHNRRLAQPHLHLDRKGQRARRNRWPRLYRGGGAAHGHHLQCLPKTTAAHP